MLCMLKDKLIEGEELAVAVAKHAFENKAKKIEVLNLKGISTIADYFVICTVDSLPQLKALRRDVDKEIKSIHSVTPRAIEGTPESLWLIIDYVDVIFHIFHDDLRTTYSLEELWSDASRLELDFLNAE